MGPPVVVVSHPTERTRRPDRREDQWHAGRGWKGPGVSFETNVPGRASSCVVRVFELCLSCRHTPGIHGGEEAQHGRIVR
jgi:hypothetical protein